MSDTPDSVVVERDGGVAVLRINRPDAMCAVDLSVKEGLLAAARELAEDPEVRCVVLTGTGRAFCVGQDLNEHLQWVKSGDVRLESTVVDHYNPLVELLATMNKPVVAAVNGVAAGAGASLAFACDLRIVHEKAGFNTAFTAIGLSCDTGASWTLQRLVGFAKAKELMFMPRTVPAQEALELGLATQVVSDAEFETTVREVAQKLADGPTLAYGSVRRAMEYSATHSFAESLANEAEYMALTGRSEDNAEAVDAFLSKRTPNFRGR